MCATIGLAIVLTDACRATRATPADDAIAVARDTLRGVVSVVGAEPLSAVMLSPLGGGAPMAIEGSQTTMLRGLSRIEVVLLGRRASRGFEADSFVVRAVDGVAAHDGVVAIDAGRAYLVHGAMRTAAPFMPEALRTQISARVFLVGPLDRDPVSYGVITAP